MPTRRTAPLSRPQTRLFTNSSGPGRTALGWSALALLAAGLPSACAPRDAPLCAGRSYQLRGRIVAVPEPHAAARLLAVQHEPLDDFADRQGKVVGMDSMTMTFPLSGRVPLAGAAAGDTVALTLCVDWEADPEVTVTRMAKLPADTRLEFRPARPPRSVGTGGSAGGSAPLGN